VGAKPLDNTWSCDGQDVERTERHYQEAREQGPLLARRTVQDRSRLSIQVGQDPLAKAGGSAEIGTSRSPPGIPAYL